MKGEKHINSCHRLSKTIGKIIFRDLETETHSSKGKLHQEKVRTET